VLPYQNISTNYYGNACISNSSSNENYHESVSDRDNYVTDASDVHLDDSENHTNCSSSYVSHTNCSSSYVSHTNCSSSYVGHTNCS
jgi:hypothetical protein